MWARTIAPIGALIFICVFSYSVKAQESDPPPFREFSFRTVTPPQPGQTGPRINIQITPEEHAAASSPPVGRRPTTETTAPPDADQGLPAGVAGGAGWFWAEISPALPADPARFWSAQTLLQAAPQAADLNVPRLSTLSGIAETHGRAILMASLETGVSPALALAVIAVESAGRAEAVSSAGAQGLMQLIPATASRFGVSDPFDAVQNISGGMAYLDWLLEEFDGDPVLALAGYNAGEGAVRQAGGVPNYAETRDYVPKVLATWLLARSLCRTPPELISDGCVFQQIALN